MKKNILTAAPEAFDGFGSETLADNVYKHKQSGHSLRLVAVDPGQLEWQLARYLSGWHFSISQEDALQDDSFAYLYERIES